MLQRDRIAFENQDDLLELKPNAHGDNDRKFHLPSFNLKHI